MKEVISVKNLCKFYESGEVPVKALIDACISIEDGDFMAIMGASGSGKSTFLNLLGCLDVPTSGDYLLDDTNVSLLNKDQLAEIRNLKIGFVFQSFNLLSRTSALENVELPLMYNNKYKAKERREKAREALNMVGLANREGRYPNQLSGGQQQRVAIARSLVNDPKIILADEPTGNLDTKTSIEVMDLFCRLNNIGKTIVLVTHEPDIASFTKTNVVFKDGRIIKNIKVIDRKDSALELAAIKSEIQE